MQQIMYTMFSAGVCFIGSKQGDSSKLVRLLMCTEGLSHSSLTILQEGALSYVALNLLISFWGYLYNNLSAWGTCLVKQWTSLGHVDGRAGETHRLNPWCCRHHVRTSKQSAKWLHVVTMVAPAGPALCELSRKSNARGAKGMMCAWVSNWYFSWRC